MAERSWLAVRVAVLHRAGVCGGVRRSCGNAWAKGVFLIDDAQLHAVRNPGGSKRSIVLCDILRRDLPRIPEQVLSKLSQS